MPLNEPQQAAADTRVPTVLVSAGAGSGKTRVLTARYLELVRAERCPLDRILTLTFTRKAAQEMRARIAAGLHDAGLDGLRRELAHAPIGTIHGFCERVLREHALQAGIDPNFRVLDEAEAHTLQENALDAVFEEVWRGTQQEREEIGRLLLDFPHTDLRASLLSVFRYARTRGVSPAAILPAPIADLPAATVRFRGAVEALLALPGGGKWPEALAGVDAAFRAWSPLLDAPGGFAWDTFFTIKNGVSALTPAGGPKETAKTARDAVKKAAGDWLSAYLDRAAQPYLAAFIVLLKRLERAYRRERDEQGLLDFEDILLITRELLVEQPDGVAGEYYRKRFRQVMVDEFQDTNPLQFSLIQAFQGDGHLFLVGDVKQAIYRFIGSDVQVFLDQERRIARLRTAGQRIAMTANYRTRPEVLQPLNALFTALWANEGADGFTFEALDAAATFIPKAEPAIELALWPAGEGNASELRTREACWIARRILQLTGRSGTAALQVTRAPEHADDAPAPRDATFGDIILLFRASTDIPRYEDALRRAGIPLYVVSGRGFYQAREVQDLIFLLAALENPCDDFSLAVVLRSPLVGVSEETLYWLSRDWRAWTADTAYPADIRTAPQFGRLWEAIAQAEALPPLTIEDREALLRFRALAHELHELLPAGQPLDLIDMILERTGYASGLLAGEGGEQRYANVQKLREVAAEFQRRGIFDLTDFRRYLTQLEALAPREASAPLDVEGSPVVRLMTIHAAKGLEAPIVFLADGGREPNAPGDSFVLTPAGLSGKLPSPDGGREQPAAYRDAVAGLIEDDRREAERLLYVALTRAREHLICGGFTKFPGTGNGGSYADLLAGLLGLDGPVAADCDLPLAYAGETYPVRAWAPKTLRAVEAQEPPDLSPTLWEAHTSILLTGAPLPIATDAAAVERFTQAVARLQPLATTRRESPLRVGVNRAICYAKCPRQYWFRHVLQHDVAPRIAFTDDEAPRETEEREQVDDTAFGLLLHGVLQRATFSPNLLAQVPALLASAARELDIAAGAGDEARLLECLRRLMALPVFDGLCGATEIHRELHFIVRERQVMASGIIDVLARNGKDWWILDYKSGHPSSDHARQVGVYALGVQQALGITPRRVLLAYLATDTPRPVRDEPVTPAQLDDARRLLLDAGDGIRREDFHPTPGRHCASCPFLTACPAGQ